MLLTYNIGNSEIRFGIMQDGELLSTFSVSCLQTRTEDEYFCIFKSLTHAKGFKPSDFEGSIGASVVPQVTRHIQKAIGDLLGVKTHLLGAGTKTGLNILIDDPAQLGGDLVALSVGALAKYKPPMVLVDFGTATTFSVIDSQGRFAGCAIAPGAELALDALSDVAGLLPQISRSVPKKCIGTNTIESMQSGVIFGNAAMVDGMIDRIEREMGASLSAIASGVIADEIIPHCAHEIIRDDTLIFFGLSKIYEKNSRNGKVSK